MTMPTEPIRDIMHRTIANLAFIEQHKSDNGPFEITQLINSFLGALAHPWEDMKDELRQITLNEAVARGWPRIAKEHASDADPQSFGDMIRVMRNGVAHGNKTLLPSSSGDIGALRIWNTRNGVRTWGAIVTVGDARSILFRFVELIEELHETPRVVLASA